MLSVIIPRHTGMLSVISTYSSSNSGFSHTHTRVVSPDQHGRVFVTRAFLYKFVNMGINIVLWRARIGCFSQPKKSVYRIKTLLIPKGVQCRFLTSVCLVTCIAAIILTCGDVESNPGPPKGSRN